VELAAAHACRQASAAFSCHSNEIPHKTTIDDASTHPVTWTIVWFGGQVNCFSGASKHVLANTLESNPMYDLVYPYVDQVHLKYIFKSVLQKSIYSNQMVQTCRADSTGFPHQLACSTRRLITEMELLMQFF
jgi:hypothetical protein